MSYSANVYRILISSPSDVRDEVNIIFKEIYRWNDLYSEKEHIVLLPVRWETHSSSRLGGDPQDLLNQQIVDQCDALIGVFWTRLGTKTKNAESGTLEEIKRIGEQNKLIMLYFSDKNINPSEIDFSQYEMVKKLKTSYFKKGIIGTYKYDEEFRQLFNKDLTLNVREIQKKITLVEDISGEETESGLQIIDSFPKDNCPIYRNEILDIFIKFNKPIDFNTTTYIGNLHVRANMFCQWNVCGWIQMAEDDTKLIWHIKDDLLLNDQQYGPPPKETDYHTFEIHVGREPKEWRLQAKDGGKLPLTKIKVKIKPENS